MWHQVSSIMNLFTIFTFSEILNLGFSLVVSYNHQYIYIYINIIKEINTWNISVCVEWMYTLYKFHFLNGISEINQLFDDILIIWQHLYIYLKKATITSVSSVREILKDKQHYFVLVFGAARGVQASAIECCWVWSVLWHCVSPPEIVSYFKADVPDFPLLLLAFFFISAKALSGQSQDFSDVFCEGLFFCFDLYLGVIHISKSGWSVCKMAMCEL